VGNYGLDMRFKIGTSEERGLWGIGDGILDLDVNAMQYIKNDKE